MLGGCGWQNNGPPEMSMPQSLEPGEYVTLHCNRDFARVTEVKDPEMGDHPGLGRLDLIKQISKSESFSRLWPEEYVTVEEE